jgi:hypothetical protein
LCSCITASAQISYFNQGFLRQPSAEADRNYLGIQTNAPGGGGTVSNLTVGNLSPLFTSSVANPTTAPAVTFSPVGQLGNLVFASPDGGLGFPSFRSLTTGDLPSITAIVRGDVSATTPVLYDNTTGIFSMHVADSTHNGYLSLTDWSTFNSKQSALTIGNLTDAGTDGITVTGGTGAVIGSGTSLSQQQADSSHNGYLSLTDWTTFNNKANGTNSTLSAYTYTNAPFAQVSSLLHFEGTNTSTIVTDSVPANIWTANGGAQLSTNWFAFGVSSLKVAASGNSCVSMPINTGYQVGSGDWTIQFYYKYIGAPQTSARVFHTRDGDTVAGIAIDLNPGGGGNTDLHLYLSSLGASFDILNGPQIALLSTTDPSEILVERKGMQVICTVNGFITYTNTLTTFPALYYNGADTVIIGGNKTGTSRSINGYIDEFRFVKGGGLLTPNRVYPLQPSFPDS